MKVLTLGLTMVFLFLTACGNDENSAASLPATLPLGEIDGQVELQLRNKVSDTDDNYVEATYSFFQATRDDVDLANNNWEILFYRGTDGRGGKDYFDTEMVVGDIGIIEDLGDMSCSDIALMNGHENTGDYKEASAGGYPHTKHRETAPDFWFRYTEVYGLLLDSRNSEVEVKEGHCYGLRKVSYDRETMAVFRVIKHDLNSSVVIDEMEVFNRKWK